MKSYKWCWGVISMVPFINTNTHIFLGDWDDFQAEQLVGIDKDIRLFETPHGWHGIGEAHMNLKHLLDEQKRLNCDPEFIRMTWKRGYATLQFQSPEEAFHWKDKSCYLVKFQRVYKGQRKGIG